MADTLKLDLGACNDFLEEVTMFTLNLTQEEYDEVLTKIDHLIMDKFEYGNLGDDDELDDEDDMEYDDDEDFYDEDHDDYTEFDMDQDYSFIEVTLPGEESPNLVYDIELAPIQTKELISQILIDFNAKK